MGLALLHSLPELLEMQETLVAKGKLGLGPYSSFPLAAFLGLIGYYLSLCLDHVVYKPELPEVDLSESEGMALGWVRSSRAACSQAVENDSPSCNHACQAIAVDMASVAELDDANMSHVKDSKVSASSASKRPALRPMHAMAPALLVMLALAFHQAIESVRMGVAGTAEEVLELFVGIVAHRPAAGVALGTQFIKAGGTWRDLLVYIVPFSALTPLAVGLGTLLAGDSVA
eukprot:scaffold432523_cov40-Prasinocladus_malaysianus.AAC.1